MFGTVAGNGTYTYYVRKHNGLIIFDSVANVSDRALRTRNCECLITSHTTEYCKLMCALLVNDFAADLKADAIPQWNFVTPNLVNDVRSRALSIVDECHS